MAKKVCSDQPSLGLALHEQARPRAGSAVHGYQWKIGAPLPSIGAHSIAKHDIYDDYIARYVHTLTKNHVQRTLRLTIVDGFCGGGRYIFGGGSLDGSPLRLLKAVDVARAKLAEMGRPDFDLDVEFVFIDEKVDHIEFLREELQRVGYGHLIGTKIYLVSKTFEDAAPGVITAIQQRGEHITRSSFWISMAGTASSFRRSGRS